MNPYYYLFYKLSSFLNKKGNNEMGPIFALTVLLGWNSIIIQAKVFRINSENYASNHKYVLLVFTAVVFIINLYLFLNKKRLKEINNRYKGETERSRKVGSFLVILYIVLSLRLLIFT